MSKICFVSYEISPTVKGGCGVFLSNAARKLLIDGHKVIFLLDIQDDQFEIYKKQDSLDLPNRQNLTLYQLTKLVPHQSVLPYKFHTIYEYQSYRFHIGLQKICQLENPDLLEFFDYCGIGYAAINSKIGGIAYQNTRMAVRLHGSIELIDREQPDYSHDFHRFELYSLEHHALRSSETVLYPSESYLSDGYLPFYENWSGKKVLSQPPVVNLPPFPAQKNDDRNVILFYGRLGGIKGVDIFVDAAVQFLSNQENSKIIFYLVGYDSHLASNSNKSYKDRLLEKIPERLKNYFIFTGHLSWLELSNLLPRVIFAVVPSYYESFCYAAHELYAAGIPLILSPLPAFKDFYFNGINALFFDGTASDLERKICLLMTDHILREKIRNPIPVANNPLGEFYYTLDYQQTKKIALSHEIDLLVVVLVNQPNGLTETPKFLQVNPPNKTRIVFAHRSELDDSGHFYSVFLGEKYSFTDCSGIILAPQNIFSGDALLILEAGDDIFHDYIDIGLNSIRENSSIVFFGSWTEFCSNKGPLFDCIPYDANPELLLLNQKQRTRFIIKTTPNVPLMDLFDPRLGGFGEIDLIWRSSTNDNFGVIIPVPWIKVAMSPKNVVPMEQYDYLVLRDEDPWRKKRLTRYLLTLQGDKKTYNRYPYYYPDVIYSTTHNILTKGIYWLGSSKLSRFLDRIPFIKKGFRKLAERMKILTPKRD